MKKGFLILIISLTTVFSAGPIVASSHVSAYNSAGVSPCTCPAIYQDDHGVATGNDCCVASPATENTAVVRDIGLGLMAVVIAGIVFIRIKRLKK